jgi:serine phosphatase RsbU (regulator of sigma subunit)
MTSVKAVLPLLAGSRPIGETMKALNEKLIGELAKREFVALLLARFDPRSGVVSFVNAGLPDPYLLRRDRVEAVTAPGPRLPLGLRKSLDYQPTQVDLQSGEAMVFLSDGLPEARTPDGDPLGYERLAAILSRTGPQVDAILQQVQVMTTDAREDDQTVVILERL